MKTCNSQIEDVKELLNNISGLAIDYDCLSGEEDMKGLIDSMSNWACEALKILEELPRDSKGGDKMCMTNDELTAAIDRTHELMYRTGESFPAHKFYTIHLERLLQIQYERASEDCPIHGAKE